MNTTRLFFFITAAATGLAVAELPRKAPPGSYGRLVSNSPFTSRPLPPPPPEPDANPLEDYALGGISPIPGGYRVTLIDRSAPDVPVFINTDREDETHGFEVVEVRHQTGNPLGTVVQLRSGRNVGTVAFDETLLTIKAPPPPPQPQQQQQQGRGGNQRGGNQEGRQQQQRQRVIDPNQQQQGNQRGGQQANQRGGQQAQQQGGRGGVSQNERLQQAIQRAQEQRGGGNRGGNRGGR